MYSSCPPACSSDDHVGCSLQQLFRVKLLSNRRSLTMRHLFFVSPRACGLGTNMTLWLNDDGCSNARFVRTSSSVISSASSLASGLRGRGFSNNA